jgi:hypothetical protein
LYFKHPLVDREPVEAVLEVGDDQIPLANARVAVVMETPDGVQVATGTATGGAVTSPSPVIDRDRRSVEPQQLRILADVEIGMQLPPVRVAPADGDQRERVASGLMTAPMEWYVGASPWGGPVCSPLTLSRMMTGDVWAPIGRILGDTIALYGALELRHHDGPVFLDEDYIVSGALTDVSETPQTEVFWCEMHMRRATDPEGEIVASLTAMARILKASSPLYAS